MVTEHYLVSFEKPIEASEWFLLVKQLKKYMREHGIEVDEFGDCHEIDRRAVREAGSRDHLEGFLIFEGRKDSEHEVRTFLRTSGRQVKSIQIRRQR